MKKSQNKKERVILSIIVPIYNSEIFLHETLDSVFNQTLEDFELITINDGSTDKSLEILNAYAKKHNNIIIKSIPNSGGAGRPRNIGIDLAKGKYIFFLDADDKLSPSAMYDAVQVAEEHNTDIVLLKMRAFGDEGRKAPASMFKKTLKKTNYIESFAYRTLGPWKLFRTNLIKQNKIKFPESYRNGEDQSFVLQAYIYAKEISILSDKTYYLLVNHPEHENKTHKHMSKTTKNNEEFLQKNYDCLDVIKNNNICSQHQAILSERYLRTSAGLVGFLRSRFLNANLSERIFFLQAAQRYACLYSELFKSLTPIRDKRLLTLLFNSSKSSINLIEKEIYHQNQNSIALQSYKLGIFNRVFLIDGNPDQAMFPIKTQNSQLLVKIIDKNIPEVKSYVKFLRIQQGISSIKLPYFKNKDNLEIQFVLLDRKPDSYLKQFIKMNLPFIFKILKNSST